MCPNSFIYSVDDIKKMNSLQLGQAIWEYGNDPIISEMIEAYGSIEGAAEAAVDFLMMPDDAIYDTVGYIIDMGYETMRAAVISYLEAYG